MLPWPPLSVMVPTGVNASVTVTTVPFARFSDLTDTVKVVVNTVQSAPDVVALASPLGV